MRNRTHGTELVVLAQRRVEDDARHIPKAVEAYRRGPTLNPASTVRLVRDITRVSDSLGFGEKPYHEVTIV